MTDATAATPIEALPLPALLALQNANVAALKSAKTNFETVAAEMARRYGESAKQALAQAGKSHGTTTLPLQDGFVAKAEMKQTVKWDSDKLMEIAKELPWERVTALFKVEFSMSETIYKGVAALSPEMQKKIDAARTTKIGDPVVVLQKAA